MSPPFQRKGGIWTRNDEGYLIDSILNEYDIPKFYIADFTYFNSPLNTSRKAFAVIDGKQRLSAIFDFFSGKLLLNDDFQYTADPTIKVAGLGYQDLQKNYPTIARKFDNFSITVMSVITDEEGRINELFVRLNRSKPLVGAEVRAAMRGIVPPLISKLAEHKFFKNNISFNVSRKQDHEQAAKMLLIEFRGRFVDIKKTHLNRFVEEGIASEAQSFDSAAQRVEEVLNHMSEIFTDKDPLLKKIGILPVYYWFVKHQAGRNKNQIREFLVKFERQRNQNSVVSKLAPKERLERNAEMEVDEELLNYDVLNLKPNDQGSLTGRYTILEKRFRKYLEERKEDSNT